MGTPPVSATVKANSDTKARCFTHSRLEVEAKRPPGTSRNRYEYVPEQNYIGRARSRKVITCGDDDGDAARCHAVDEEYQSF
jgi:hypothetical protein